MTRIVKQKQNCLIWLIVGPRMDSISFEYIWAMDEHNHLSISVINTL